MDIKEAINTALEYETRVREVYVEARDEATNEVARKIYALMADEENDHVEYLKHKLSTWLETGKLSADDLESAVPDAEAVARAVGELVTKVESEDQEREIAVLERAAEVEKETSAFYERMVDELSAGGEFFRRFVTIENGHLALVLAEIDALRGSGFWFDMPEFDLEKA